MNSAIDRKMKRSSVTDQAVKREVDKGGPNSSTGACRQPRKTANDSGTMAIDHMNQKQST